jgi:protease-4
MTANPIADNEYAGSYGHDGRAGQAHLQSRVTGGSARVRTTSALFFCTALAAGCGHINAHVQSDNVVHGSVAARIDGNMTALLDPGPLIEANVPPDGCAAGACKVAVIEVDGLLVNFNPAGPYSAGDNPVAVFKEKLDTAAADPAVRAVVLRINTPGGGVAASDLMRHALVEFRRQTGKPVVACILDLGTGGGYFIATACDAIVAIPSSVVGGIGVLLNLYYAEVAMEQMNVFSASIKSGERIDMGTSERKLTDQEKKLFSAMARDYHEAFKQAVLSSRSRVQGDAVCLDGRVMTAGQAAAEGLIDSVGYLPDAIALAGRLGKAESVRAIVYCRKSNPARSLLATTSNRPVGTGTLPWSVPGLDRSRLPLFLYIWQPEPTVLRLTGI